MGIVLLVLLVGVVFYFAGGLRRGQRHTRARDSAGDASSTYWGDSGCEPTTWDSGSSDCAASDPGGSCDGGSGDGGSGD
jgi:hypothetical protein